MMASSTKKKRDALRAQRTAQAPEHTFQQTFPRNVRHAADATKLECNRVESPFREYACKIEILVPLLIGALSYLATELKYDDHHINNTLLAEGHQPLTPDILKNLVLWYAQSSQSQIQNLPSLNSCTNFVHKVTTVIARRTGAITPRSWFDDIIGADAMI